jgi:hypothetical protein
MRTRRHGIELFAPTGHLPREPISGACSKRRESPSTVSGYYCPVHDSTILTRCDGGKASGPFLASSSQARCSRGDGLKRPQPNVGASGGDGAVGALGEQHRTFGELGEHLGVASTTWSLGSRAALQQSKEVSLALRYLVLTLLAAPLAPLNGLLAPWRPRSGSDELHNDKRLGSTQRHQ